MFYLRPEARLSSDYLQACACLCTLSGTENWYSCLAATAMPRQFARRRARLWTQVACTLTIPILVIVAMLMWVSAGFVPKRVFFILESSADLTGCPSAPQMVKSKSIAARIRKTTIPGTNETSIMRTTMSLRDRPLLAIQKIEAVSYYRDRIPRRKAPHMRRRMMMI